MNTQKIRELLTLYKANFQKINKLEIYKWQIAKRFQGAWDINSDDFYSMLESSLSRTNNILDSGNYFPRRMLLENTRINPEDVRQLFIDLFNEEADLVQRIQDFRRGFEVINRRNFPGRKHYQDDRAIMVYLSLRFPNSYYLYKYTMFKDFVDIVDFPYEPKVGDLENVTQYLMLCSLLQEEVAQDSDLLDLHRTRIGPTEYMDTSYTILTQDVIYAGTFHLPKLHREAAPPASDRLLKTEQEVIPGSKTVTLSPSFTNYIELERQRKRIGDLGELLVMDWEREKLAELGIDKKPEHHSVSKGDGLGYDILSYDEHGEVTYIEVKTTTASANQPFFITKHELERSRRDQDKFVLYRLYDFDSEDMSAKFFEIRGDLSKMCNNPVLFQAILA